MAASRMATNLSEKITRLLSSFKSPDNLIRGSKAHVSSNKQTLFRNNGNNSELPSPDSFQPALINHPTPPQQPKNLKSSFKNYRNKCRVSKEPEQAAPALRIFLLCRLVAQRLAGRELSCPPPSQVGCPPRATAFSGGRQFEGTVSLYAGQSCG